MTFQAKNNISYIYEFLKASESHDDAFKYISLFWGEEAGE